ncbi:hypothetical protein [Arthrobacter sp. UYCo732]|uniref:hypothetical protein n=1 Tax=Arthrobacter sp. UYCo732 TaxID=3156336 RepID=UPI0033949F10
MPHYPDDVVRYTRDDILQTLAETLGSTPDDARIVDAYEQIVSEWALHAEDSDAEYMRFFQEGPVATRIDLAAAQAWATGRVLL